MQRISRRTADVIDAMGTTKKERMNTYLIDDDDVNHDDEIKISHATNRRNGYSQRNGYNGPYR